jgi:hypothetical protein
MGHPDFASHLSSRPQPLVIQAPLEKQLSGFGVGHGYLLVACVKITTYN